MLDRTIDARARLEQARAELKTVSAELAALEAGKAAASRSREGFENWRGRHSAVNAERERLPLLIDTLEREVAQSNSAEADEDRRKRYAALEAAIPKLAQRIHTDVAKANLLYRNLISDTAAMNLEIQAINADLPEGLEPLSPADFVARALPALPRQELDRDRTFLWVTRDGGGIVGDQDAVRDLGDGKGTIDRGGLLPPTRCRAALFDRINFHAAVPAERPVPLWSVRLVDPDGPGIAFDGTNVRDARGVLAELARRDGAGERSRMVETELLPVPVEVAEEAR